MHTNALVIKNTLFQQHKRRLYTWTSPDGQHRNQTDYILCSQRWRSSIQSAKTRLGADCGSDHKLNFGDKVASYIPEEGQSSCLNTGLWNLRTIQLLSVKLSISTSCTRCNLSRYLETAFFHLFA